MLRPGCPDPGPLEHQAPATGPLSPPLAGLDRGPASRFFDPPAGRRAQRLVTEVMSFQKFLDMAEENVLFSPNLKSVEALTSLTR
jgi:hypothetical protein